MDNGEEISTSTWQGTIPFFNFLKEQWSAQAKAREALIGADSLEDKAIYLELIYDSLQVTIDVLSYYLSDAELQDCDDIIKEIDKTTNEQEIIYASLTSKELSEIRNKLKKLSRLLWKYQGKYELLPKVEKRRINTDTFQMAEEENI